jgi:hypothetical protein
MAENCNAKDFENFKQQYISNRCEDEVLKITILSDYNIAGGARSRGEDYYSAFIKSIAYINENNEVVKDKLSFTYYVNNGKDRKFIHTKEFKAYRITCKKFKDKDFYYLLKIKKVREKKFIPLVKELLKPIVVNVHGTTLTYNRGFSSYQGKLNVNNVQISLDISPDDNSVEANASLQTLDKIMSDFNAFYDKVLNNLAKDIVINANAWNEGEELTVDVLKTRIASHNDIVLEIDDKRFSIYFDDDDIFLGHTIIYYGNIEEEEFSVDIAG